MRIGAVKVASGHELTQALSPVILNPMQQSLLLRCPANSVSTECSWNTSESVHGATGIDSFQDLSNFGNHTNHQQQASQAMKVADKSTSALQAAQAVRAVRSTPDARG